MSARTTLRRTLPVVIALALVSSTAGCSTLGAQVESAPTSRSHVSAAKPTQTPTPRPQPAAAQPAAAAVSSLAVQAQLDYVLAYWQDYNPDYGVIDDNDCVNFASQSLLARGWQEDDDWYHDADDIVASSRAWRSSTGMRDWLETRPDLATPLDDSQRDQVKPGDIVQFDWDDSGDRDHTGVVTRVVHTDAGTKVYFAGHTEDSDYRDVDTAITVDHPGGTAYYFSLAQ